MRTQPAKCETDPSNLNTLIEQVYEAVLNPALWPQLLDQMGSYLNAASSRVGDEPIVLNDDAHNTLESHFKRALKIQKKVSRLESMAQTFSSVLNRLPIGILLVRRNASLVASNQLADDVIHSGEHLFIRNGKLLASSTANTLLIHDAIRKAFATEHQSPISIRMGLPEDQISIWITNSSGIHPGLHASEAMAAMFVYSPKIQMKIPMSDFMTAYHLTPAEGKLARTLINGCHTLNDAADILGVSKHTVRSQIKSIFYKTATNSQTELIKKVLTSPSVLMHKYAGADVMTQHNENHRKSSQFMRLKDGRQLEWNEFGAPHGTPVIVFHDLTNVHPDYNLSTEIGLRLIVPERPGACGSDPLPGRTFMDWPEDINQLADHLRLTSFSLIGLSEGTPYALACINRIPNRINHLTLVSCMAPVRSEQDLEGMLPLNHTVMRMAHQSPELLAGFMDVLLKELTQNVASYFDTVAEYQPAGDIAVLNDPETQERFLHAYQAAANENPRQLCEEIILCSSDWPVDPGLYHGPVSIWHGLEDPLIPISMGKRIAAMLPNPRLHFIEGEGNYVFYSHWNEILEASTSHTPSAFSR